MLDIDGPNEEIVSVSARFEKASGHKPAMHPLDANDGKRAKFCGLSVP
jgi:hypothetical protein